jgi:CRP/FNR family transcriptional regulator, cyclic AMP receptor protein
MRTGRWFARLPVTLQTRLLDVARTRVAVAEERVFSRGDACSGLFAIVSGGIRISGIADCGKEAVLALLDAPTWFGEISVLDGEPRTHDATATCESVLLHVPQPALDEILLAEPLLWKYLALLVTAKLRLAFTVLEDHALVPLSVRLAKRLALMVEGYGDHANRMRALGVNQEELASMMAMSRQTTNQLLRDFETRGLVRLSYGRVEILDLPGLRRAAQANDAG